MTAPSDPWSVDAASSAALLEQRDPAEMLQLCVLELVAREVWSVQRVTRGRKTVEVLIERGPRPDLPKALPLMRVDALLRELGPRPAKDEAQWGGSGEIELKVVGGWVRARWGSRLGFVDEVVYGPMQRAGLMRAERDRHGVRRFQLTEEGKRLGRELRALLKPLQGRRGRKLVGNDPVAAFAAATALGPAVLLVGDLLAPLDEIRMDPRVGSAAASGFVPVGIFGFDGGVDFGFASGDGSSHGWDGGGHHGWGSDGGGDGGGGAGDAG